MRNDNFLHFLLLALLAFSCGKEEDNKRSPLRPASALPLDSPRSCQKGLSNFEGMNFNYWNGTNIASQEFRQEWSSEHFITSSFINEVQYGYKQQYSVKDSCKSRPTVESLLTRRCILGENIISRAHKLKLCLKKDYPLNSMESATLSMLGAIDLVATFWSDLTIDDVILPPINIVALPRIEFDILYDNENLALTDNASWSPPRGTHPAEISIYPASKQSKLQKEIPYWLVPWVIAHEYGHHVFYSLQPQEMKLLFQGQTATNIHKLRNLSGLNFKQQNELIAINEGFADLFAHYVFGNSSKQITSLGCKLQERNPKEHRLNDEQPKSFSRYKKKPAVDSCKSTNIGDVHTLGSIYAHYLDQQLILGSHTSSTEKGKIVIRFFKVFLETISAKLRNKRSVDIRYEFANMFTLFYETNIGFLRSDQVELYEKVFEMN